MRSRNAWIFAGIAAAAVVITVQVGRSRRSVGPPSGTGEKGAPAAGSATPDGRRTIPAPLRQPPRPIRSGAGASGDPFAAEPRDPAWAAVVEDEIRQRLGHLDLASSAIECRASQCRIVITTRDVDSLSTAVSGLGDPGALYGYADQIVLTEQGTTPEGEAFVVAYARFDQRDGGADAAPADL